MSIEAHSEATDYAVTNPETEKPQRAKFIKKALAPEKFFNRKGVLDHLFAQMFSGLVYPQIWEDPLVDLEAMELKDHHHIVAIASGGCNVLSYLSANPGKITAVDLNRAHVALTRTKLCAARHLPSWEAFHTLFAVPHSAGNLKMFNAFIRPHLDPASISYWHGRDAKMRPRTKYLTTNIYKHGLLGRFIGLCHHISQRYGVRFEKLLTAKNRDEQIAFFEQSISPLLDKKALKWLTSHPASLYGLGIPPAQYEALAACADGDMSEVLRARLRKLCCDFDINDNYFAWQAFARQYGGTGENALPPYLQQRHYNEISKGADKVSVHQSPITDILDKMKPCSVDRFVLLDAQDWMDDKTLNELWSAITRTATPNARVIFRTAGFETILPGRVNDKCLSLWRYLGEKSTTLNARDRSAIYGGFHIYELVGNQ